ncbi:hypothetical protein [Acidovorax sp. Leaf160]|uniref:hypothetical protein n=1 Tax=Acidovorax sp. Leaf160 TaxID=1736280 RepID=UPI0012E3CAD1|nr:hypothetical protein [Acidovorax sp. Leaf160]
MGSTPARPTNLKKPLSSGFFLACWAVIFASQRNGVPQRLRRQMSSRNEAAVTPPYDRSKLFATYQRAAADAAHKQSLVKAAGSKGPKAIQAALETSAKAVKRRDSYAQKLADLGVSVEG